MTDDSLFPFVGEYEQGVEGEEPVKRSLAEQVRRIPADIVATVTLTVLASTVVLVPVLGETILAALFAVPLLLFLPGYAFVSAIFPERGERPIRDAPSPAEERSSGARHDRSLDGLERVVLSLGFSVVIVATLGLVHSYLPWGLRSVPIVLSIVACTTIAAAGATHRRWNLSPEARFRVSHREWFEATRATILEPGSRSDVLLNILLVLSVLLAVSSVAYAFAVPQSQFSEFYLLVEDEDGNLTAANYPEQLVEGEPVELTVGVENHEHDSIEYTVVVLVEEVESDDGEPTVSDRHEVTTYETGMLDHGETWRHDHEVASPITGDDLRLTYLLYKDEPPDDPSPDTAYQKLHVWVDVVESDED